MTKHMATRRGVRVSGKDPCAFCGEQLSVTAGPFSFGRAGAYETVWDGQRWAPYHRICWQQAQFQGHAQRFT